MDKYTITKAYHWTKDNELRIESDSLEYIEMGALHGCQSRQQGDTNAEITELCSKVADLIRRIDSLNNNLPF